MGVFPGCCDGGPALPPFTFPFSLPNFRLGPLSYLQSTQPTNIPVGTLWIDTAGGEMFRWNGLSFDDTGIGAVGSGPFVSYNPQTLSPAQQAQVVANLGLQTVFPYIAYSVSQALNGVQQAQAKLNAGFANYYVELYGAKGDGVTDDSLAIQAAIAACFSGGGGNVVFQAKVYLCTGLTIPSAFNVPIVFSGVPFTAFYQTGSTTVTTSSVTILRLPTAGGTMFTVNGTSAGAQVFYVKFFNLMFEGQALAGMDGFTSIGVRVGQFVRWSQVDNCSFQFFGDQALWMGGIAYEVSYVYIDYCLRTQPRTRTSAPAEFYGTDGMVSHCEFSAQQRVETAITDPSVMFNRAVLVQASNCFFDDVVAEAGDTGWLLSGKVNAAPLSGGFDWPQGCTNNHFHKCRASNNWGNGFEVLTFHSSPCENNTFEGCWGDENGLDVTSARLSPVNAITSTYSDANFVVQGQQNILANCSSLPGAIPANLYYGYIILDSSSAAGSFNSVTNFKAPTNAYLLGVGTNHSFSTGGTKTDPVDTSVVAQTIASNALDTTNATTITILDPSTTSVTSFITTDNQGTQWVSGSNYLAGVPVSNLGVGYLVKLAIVNSTTAPASDSTHFLALNQYAQAAQRLRLIAQHGNTTVNVASVTWSNGRARRFVSAHQCADLQLLGSSWTEPGPPKVSAVSTAQTFSAVANGASTSFSVTVTGCAVGDLVTGLGPNQSIAGCSWSGVVTAANTVLITLTNNTGGSVTPSSSPGTFNVEVTLY